MLILVKIGQKQNSQISMGESRNVLYTFQGEAGNTGKQMIEIEKVAELSQSCSYSKNKAQER